jgi:magnesium chelatase family protein
LHSDRGSELQDPRFGPPLLDRTDINIEVPAVKFKALLNDRARENSAETLKRVVAARKIQKERYQRGGILCKAQLKPKHFK